MAKVRLKSTNKIFRTLDEQIEILKDKGLVIDDEYYAKTILLRENYFFLTGYRHLLLKSQTDRKYLPNANFKELYAIFNFDRQIRNIIFKNLLIIENNAKSIFSYQLSKKYGFKEKEYLQPSNFTNNPEKFRQVNDLLKKMKRQIRVNGNQHSATKHYQNNYGYIPLWIVVKVLSFGIVCELFTIMKKEDQIELSQIYRIDPDTMSIYLPILANYRNLCAHEDILYNHRTQKPIPDTIFHRELNIKKLDGEFIYGKDDLFALIIILKQMISDDEFKLLINEITYEIDILAGKLKTIKIDKMLDAIGFPTNFREICFLDKE
ncbi:MAG: Abi family protein [Bacilli bacterium]|nr:Abi family protein [Bacilli bacterium]